MGNVLTNTREPWKYIHIGWFSFRPDELGSLVKQKEVRIVTRADGHSLCFGHGIRPPKKTTSEKQKTLICGIYEKSKERDVNFGDIKHLSMHLIPMCHKSVRQKSSRQKSTVKIIEKENKRFGKQEARIGNNNKRLWKEFVSTRERGFPCFTRLNRRKREKKRRYKGKTGPDWLQWSLTVDFPFFFFFSSAIFSTHQATRLQLDPSVDNQRQSPKER